MKRTQIFGRVVDAPILVVVCALVLAGCKPGTITEEGFRFQTSGFRSRWTAEPSRAGCN